MAGKTLTKLLPLIGLLVGCAKDGPAAVKGSPSLELLAVDTSGSAVAEHPRFFGEAAQAIMDMPEASRLYVYRFDAAPAEVHSGEPPATQEDASDMLNKALSHRTATKGTNLAKLFRLMDRQIESHQGPVWVLVFTDAGTELMSSSERMEVRTITKRWAGSDRLQAVEFVGVVDGQREALRDMVAISGDRLKIE